MPTKFPLTNRKSIRLKGYDYSKPGYYFITTVVNDWECVLGEVIENKMNLSYLGEITQKALVRFAVILFCLPVGRGLRNA
jgi:hypothetical protein